MKFIKFNKKKTFPIIVGLEVILLVSIIGFILYYKHYNKVDMVMGGRFTNEVIDNKEHRASGEDISAEKYFRPSKLPIINYRVYDFPFFEEFQNKKINDINIPKELLKTPEETIINYYSILREAANPEEGKGAGCGTLGYVKFPYPVAYNFLKSSYKQKLSYDDYLKSFKNILHINLIKLHEVPTDEKHPKDKKYFVEIETIEGSDRGVGQFAYYYGYIYISKEGDVYKISDMDLYAENYLCAPYHGWSYIAEYVVDIKYGNWCSLVKERYPTEQEGYVKKVPFKGTDGNDYLIEFFTLTNDYDIEVAQYKKDDKGSWQLINLNPEKCLEKNTY